MIKSESFPQIIMEIKTQFEEFLKTIKINIIIHIHSAERENIEVRYTVKLHIEKNKNKMHL